MKRKGTGLSNTVTAETLAKEGRPADQAEYLKNFRADSIGMLTYKIRILVLCSLTPHQSKTVKPFEKI